MNLTDTHAHLYAEEFDADRNEIIQRSIASGVTKIFLPNIDSGSIEGLLQLSHLFPENCFPMMGLHPCSVKETYKTELNIIQEYLFSGKDYIAVGEIGLDLYWDRTFKREQEEAFILQCQWAAELDLPVAIHTRNAHRETIACLLKLDRCPQGVFHCFGGTLDEANEIIGLGFKLGIGGIVTYKNSGLPDVLAKIDLQHILLETDAPYLPPVPYRGKRNESSHLLIIAEKLAEIYRVPVHAIAEMTSRNAEQLFRIPA